MSDCTVSNIHNQYKIACITTATLNQEKYGTAMGRKTNVHKQTKTSTQNEPPKQTHSFLSVSPVNFQLWMYSLKYSTIPKQMDTISYPNHSAKQRPRCNQRNTSSKLFMPYLIYAISPCQQLAAFKCYSLSTQHSIPIPMESGSTSLRRSPSQRTHSFSYCAIRTAKHAPAIPSVTHSAQTDE